MARLDHFHERLEAHEEHGPLRAAVVHELHGLLQPSCLNITMDHSPSLRRSQPDLRADPFLRAVNNQTTRLPALSSRTFMSNPPRSPKRNSRTPSTSALAARARSSAKPRGLHALRAPARVASDDRIPTRCRMSAMVFSQWFSEATVWVAVYGKERSGAAAPLRTVSASRVSAAGAARTLPVGPPPR